VRFSSTCGELRCHAGIQRGVEAMCYEIDAWVTAVPMVFVGITTLTAAVLSIKNIFWPMAMKPGTHFQGLLDSVLMSIFIVGLALVLFEAARRCWKTLHGGPIPPEAFGPPEAKKIAPREEAPEPTAVSDGCC
jgi:carbon starvation protein CstA